MRKFSWQRGAVGSVGVATATGSGCCVMCRPAPIPINRFDLLRDTTRRDTTCDLPLPTPVTTKPCLIPSFLPSSAWQARARARVRLLLRQHFA